MMIGLLLMMDKNISWLIHITFYSFTDFSVSVNNKQKQGTQLSCHTHLAHPMRCTRIFDNAWGVGDLGIRVIYKSHHLPTTNCDFQAF